MSSSRTGTVLIGLATAVVLATLVAALSSIGSPGSQREVRIDARRVAQLDRLEVALQRHWNLHKALPASLSDLVAQTAGLRLPLADPESGAPYEYRVTGTSDYELCATFGTDTSDEKAASPARVSDEWLHGQGRQCFKRSTKKQDDEP